MSDRDGRQGDASGGDRGQKSAEEDCANRKESGKSGRNRELNIVSSRIPPRVYPLSIARAMKSRFAGSEISGLSLSWKSTLRRSMSGIYLMRASVPPRQSKRYGHLLLEAQGGR